MAAKAPKAKKPEAKAPEAKAPEARGGKTPSGKAAAAKDDTGGKKPNALQQPLRPSAELAAVVGSDPLPRGEVVSKVWAYIKANDLQNPQNRREILADGKLEPIFGAKKVTMFEMNKHLARHLK
jgi:chromatin remodeling complex protein RSC6